MVSNGICGIVNTDFSCVGLQLEGKNVSWRITKCIVWREKDH